MCVRKTGSVMFAIWASRLSWQLDTLRMAQMRCALLHVRLETSLLHSGYILVAPHTLSRLVTIVADSIHQTLYLKINQGLSIAKDWCAFL